MVETAKRTGKKLSVGFQYRFRKESQFLRKAVDEGRLGEIYADISAHFALEERVMQERRYDALAEHKLDHERLLDDLRDMMDEQAAGRRLDDRRFGAALGQWFSGHFQTHDARFHRYLAR